MSIKIKNISISGIRGVKNRLDLSLNGNSLLLYGDNGSGKSSISDSIEWFYTDKVSHLSSIEIDLKDAIRNSSLAETDISEVSLSFTKSEYDCSKRLFNKRNKLIVECSNLGAFNDYLSKSVNENILLRYQSLSDFIDDTKGEKLKYLSDIIGYSEVTKKKEVLQKSYNHIKTEIKNQNFETLINTQKQTIIEKIGAAVSQESNLFEKINEKIKPLKTGIVVNSIRDIENVLDYIKKPANNKLISELNSLENANSTVTNLKNEIDFINSAYEKYFDEFESIANDVQSIMQTFLGELLKLGRIVLEKKYHKSDTCPLCLQPKKLDVLQSEITARLKKIEESSKQKASFDKAKQELAAIAEERLKRIDKILSESVIDEEHNKDLKTGLFSLKTKLLALQNASSIKVTSGIRIEKPADSKLLNSDFEFQTVNIGRIKQIHETLKYDNSAVLFANITAAKDAFIQIKNFEKQRDKFENQRKSLEIIYNEFIKKQKEGLENFISTFSGKINEFYQYMNPGEPFQEIKIVTIGEDDELNGITIEYKFNGKWVSPPQKYFSESHINCFGLCFFLASVEAFNENNKFILLDDVISSFDTTHRKKFADLLFEKFSSYQILLLTHERDWFNNIVAPMAKNKGWLINEILWNETRGSYIDEKPNDLKELIEKSLTAGKSDNLGNPIRRYLEHIAKDICYHLDVKVSFKYNEFNEKRMADELLNELRSRINKKSKDLQTKMPIIDRLIGSNLLGNLLSHDNNFNSTVGDLKAIWSDIREFENLFICQNPDCKRRKVSVFNFENFENMIRCGCGQTKYDWKI